MIPFSSSDNYSLHVLWRVSLAPSLSMGASIVWVNRP
jgi:hypothetical protein